MGRFVGLIISGALGGFILGVLLGPSLAIIGVPIGLVLSFFLVRFGLMDAKPLRPILRWLYPYEEWTGRKSDED